MQKSTDDRKKRAASLGLRSVGFAIGMSSLVFPAAVFAQGLSVLTDDALLVDLARRNQTALLERAFELNKTPPDQRDAIRATAALAKLNATGRQMPAAQRQAELTKIVGGIKLILPQMNDPRRVAEQADALLGVGVLPDVNTLEYWGPSLGTQAQLKPVVETVIQMLDRAATLADDRAGKLAETVQATDSAGMKRIDDLVALSQVAEQSKALAGYYLSLCYDLADPKRKETAQVSIAYLEGYDVDGNPARANLKLVLGKLYGVAGEFDKARDAFDFVIDLPVPDTNDKPTAAAVEARQAQTFEARYFRAVLEVLANNPTQARQQHDALLAWQKQHPSDDASIAIANALLDYRITSIEPGDAAKSRAASLLVNLLERRPDLESQIMTQLRLSISPNAPIATMEPLLLRALVADAQEQVVRSQRDGLFTPEVNVLERGLGAAEELGRRKGRAGVDERLVADAQFLAPVFLEFLDRKAEAAGRYLDYAEANRDRADAATAALTNAQRLFAQLGGLSSDDPSVTTLYDRILPLALGEPFNQKELAFDWAVRLQQANKPTDAAQWFERVDPSDRRYASARYFLLVALSQQLDQLPADDKNHAILAGRIQQLADEVRRSATEALGAATDDRARMVQRQRLGRTSLLAASIARAEQNDAKRALELLDNIEPTLAGLPDEAALLGEAMFTRIQANMQLGSTDAAVADLVKLLEKSGGTQGAQIVFNMLTKLERDFALAEQNGDRNTMAQLQTNRATLTPYLVRWAENNSRDEIKKAAYSYRVYDAETQRLAADFLDDPAAQRAKRQQALELFESLNSADGRKQFLASRDASLGPAKHGYDPQVLLGIARVRFDDGQWESARDTYAQLLSDRAVGTAIATIRDAGGQDIQADNDVYWEATLRLIQAKVKAGDDVEPLQSLLREQMIRWGERVGGIKWKGQFEALRQSLIPDFVVPAGVVVPAMETTQPAAATP